MFCSSDQDDLSINLAPLRKRNPIKILASSYEQNNMKFGPSCPKLTSLDGVIPEEAWTDKKVNYFIYLFIIIIIIF